MVLKPLELSLREDAAHEDPQDPDGWMDVKALCHVRVHRGCVLSGQSSSPGPAVACQAWSVLFLHTVLAVFSVAMIRHPGQRNVEKERVSSSYKLQFVTEGSLDRNSSKTVEEHCSLPHAQLAFLVGCPGLPASAWCGSSELGFPSSIIDQGSLSQTWPQASLIWIVPPLRVSLPS